MSELLLELQSLDLTKNEATVYLHVLQYGEQKAGEIAEHLNMHRNLVYRALTALESDKLIAVHEVRGVKTFVALNPKQLMGLVKKKKALASSLIHDLQSLHIPSHQEVIVHTGVEEMRSIELQYYTSLREEEAQYILAVSPQWKQIMGPQTIKKLIRVQKKRQFRVMGLSRTLPSFESEFVEETDGLSEFRTSKQLFGGVQETSIYPTAVLIKLFVDPYTTIEIRNAALAKDYRDMFLELWKGTE